MAQAAAIPMYMLVVSIFAALCCVAKPSSSNVTAAGLPEVVLSDYYNSIDPMATDQDMKKQLHALLQKRTTISYERVWQAFAVVDAYLPNYPCNKAEPNLISDVYSNFCWKNEKITPGGQCGNYVQEGDCYNREHGWPKSWWGGFSAGKGAQTDLFAMWPSDGYVNAIRGNFPLGRVTAGTSTYTSTNGCTLGVCDSSDHDGKCFEPPDYLKGDFARSYFYMSVMYMGVWDCCDVDGVNASTIKPWLEKELRDWHRLDEVDDSERQRTQIVYEKYQKNRNAFVDHPEWVNQISDF